MQDINGIISNSEKFKRANQIKGVYFLINSKNKIVYVGSSFNCHLRIDDHKRRQKIRFDNFYTDPYRGDSRTDLHEIEAKYIKMLKPIYNIQHNPDYLNNRDSLWFNFLIYFNSFADVARQTGLSAELVSKILKSNSPEKFKEHHVLRGFFDKIISKDYPKGSAYIEALHKPNQKDKVPFTRRSLKEISEHYSSVLRDLKNELTKLDEDYEKLNKRAKNIVERFQRKIPHNQH